MTPDELIAKWEPSGGAEGSNAQPFVIDLCDLLGVPRPDPAQPQEARNDYVFERSVKHVERGVVTTNRIDCYRRGRFILESKQSSSLAARAARPDQPSFLPEEAAPVRGGTARRGTPGWDRAMRRAYAQARGYVGDLPPDHAAPPFLVVVDVGHVIELYADFSGQGRNYTQFPSRADYQIPLHALRDPAIRERLRAVWEEPHALNPAIRSAEVTRDVAERLAKVAAHLEGRHEPAVVAGFLMRCLFTMFAEDVELIPRKHFQTLLGELRDRPDAFVPALEHLWATMDGGGFEPRTQAVLRRFNGALFKDRTALPLERDAIHELHVAAGRDWREVEPAIFGTFLERALDPRERSRLGAHYTPRAYVERLVVPTVIEPLREDWQDAQARMAELVDAGDAAGALVVARGFHHQLCTTRVLDPACGTGNFLYVALELMKRLEGEVLEAVEALGGQGALGLSGETVDPSQFLGLELNPRAVAIADLVLWIGYLQWQLRQGGLSAVGDPVLQAHGTIREQDAVLAYDERRPRLDPEGRPVTAWDGFTTKPHPVTGLPVPDETARVQAYDYRGARRAPWPEAEFVVGNPPFVGRKELRALLGDGYVEAMWKARPKVSGSANFVMQWWDEAARRLATKSTSATPNPLRRFGFITTSTLTQTYSRGVVERHLGGRVPMSLAFAVPDHPWSKGADSAAVRIAMTVVRRGAREGTLARVVSEKGLNTDAPAVILTEAVGMITAKLTVGVNVANAQPLWAANQLSFQGCKLAGAGFLVDEGQRRNLAGGDEAVLARLPLYFAGTDLTTANQGRYAIDLSGLTADEAGTRFAGLYQHIMDHVKPYRDQNRGMSPRKKWWLFDRWRPNMRDALSGLSTYFATSEVSKHRFFVRLNWPDVLLDGSAIAIALDGADHFAVLSSRVHVAWALEAGGRMGVGNDPRYQNDRTFDPFPFPALLTDPAPDDAARASLERLRELGERLDAHRAERLAAHRDLTLTGLYNRLERRREALGGGAPLSEEERLDHERARTPLLAELHDAIDRAALAAYGWSDLADALVGRPGGTVPSAAKDARQEAAEEAMLARLVALNRERAAEEARGVVRWLRPEYQAPRLKARVPQPGTEQMEAALDALAPTDAPPWPAEPRAQFGAVRALLDAAPEPLPPEAVARAFRGRLTPRRRARVAEVLAIMADLGIARTGERDGATLFQARR